MAEKVEGLYGNFVFIGNAIIPKDAKKFHSKDDNGNGFEYERVNFGLKITDSNALYLDVMGGHFTKDTKIKVKDKEKNDKEVDWEDRFDKSILDNIQDYYKIKLQLVEDEEEIEFISKQEAVQYIKDNLKKDTRYVVTGGFEMNRYKDKNTKKWVSNPKYNVSRIRLATDDDENKAELTLSFIFDKESWDESRLKEEKKVDLSVYFTTKDKNNKDDDGKAKQIFVPLNLVVNCANIDFENPEHKEIYDYYKETFTSVKRGEYYQTKWLCKVVRGAEESEDVFTEADLTEQHKKQIRLGFYTKEQILAQLNKKKAGVKISEIRLISPINEAETDDVVKLTDYTEDDFIVPEVEEEKLDDVLNNKKASTKTETSNASIEKVKGLFD